MELFGSNIKKFPMHSGNETPKKIIIFFQNRAFLMF